MSTLSYVWLAAMGVLFAAWAFFWFRSLFRIRADFRASLPPGASPWRFDIPRMLTAYMGFFTAPKYARDRRIVFTLTAALFAMIFAQSLLFPRLG